MLKCFKKKGEDNSKYDHVYEYHIGHEKGEVFRRLTMDAKATAEWYVDGYDVAFFHLGDGRLGQYATGKAANSFMMLIDADQPTYARMEVYIGSTTSSPDDCVKHPIVSYTVHYWLSESTVAGSTKVDRKIADLVQHKLPEAPLKTEVIPKQLIAENERMSRRWGRLANA